MIIGQHKTSPKPMFAALLWELRTEAVQKTAWGHIILVLDIYFLMYSKSGFSIFKKNVTGISQPHNLFREHVKLYEVCAVEMKM